MVDHSNSIEELVDRARDAEQELSLLANEMVYEGNSVSWWASKARNYGNALGVAWVALKGAGIEADGNTSVAQGIEKLAAKNAEQADEIERLRSIEAKARQYLHLNNSVCTPSALLNAEDDLRAALSGEKSDEG